MKKLIFLPLFLLFLAGCDKYYISVSQSKIDEEFLASTKINTPDPRKEDPPLGDRLIIEWQMPKELIEQKPSLYLDIIYKDYTEKHLVYPVKYCLDYITYDLLADEYLSTKGILTYRAQVKTSNGEVFRSWHHQLWTELIVIEDTPPSSISPGNEWDIDEILEKL